MGKHSGRNALLHKVQELGYSLTQEELDKVFEDFKILADEKKESFEDDLHTLIQKQTKNRNETGSNLSLGERLSRLNLTLKIKASFLPKVQAVRSFLMLFVAFLFGLIIEFLSILSLLQ